MRDDQGQNTDPAARQDAARLGARRVLILASWFPSPAQPGLGSFVLDQAQALRRHRGLDVRVLSGRPMPIDTARPWATWSGLRRWRDALAAAAWRDHAGMPVLDVPYPAGAPLPVLSNARAYAGAMTAVAERVRASFSFDVIHAHTTYLDGTAGVQLARRFGVGCVVTEHTGPFADLMRRPWTRRRVVKTLSTVDRAFAVSEALAAEMRSWLPDAVGGRVGVLRNGVDPELFTPAARHAPDPRRPRVGAIGVFRAVKDPESLLRAFAGLRAAVPGAELHLVGEGELAPLVRDRCAALGIANAVHQHGALDRAGLADFLRETCDVLLISSRVETFGLAALEALACGKPVVSTRCGGPEEIVDNPMLGRLCPVGDVPALTAALRDVCARLSEFDATALRRSAVERFALADVARDLHAVYDDLLAARTRSRA